VVGIIAGGEGALTRSVEGAEDHPEDARRDLDEVSLSAADCVVGIATSGRTPYVIAALEYANSIRAMTIGIACNRDSELEAAARLTITPIVGPEVISGSTRLKAGTATKLVLNMLTTGAMIRLGKTYGNLMVDLRATNEKLRIRSRRIVRLLTNLDDEGAGQLLTCCDGEVKTAIVVGRLGVSVDEARQRLEQHGGHLRTALKE
jgi:N-acetylmuramic acid 6-phosphate etherase